MVLRAALMLVLGIGAACAQTPTITDYHVTPAVIGATAGKLTCNVYAQHPGTGQTQMWCTLNGLTVFNAVLTTSAIGFTCSVTDPSVDVALALVPATSPMIGYQLVAEVRSQGPPLTLGPITSSSPTTAVLGGTF